MTNKLYTEEQVNRALELLVETGKHNSKIIEQLTPIELPNDEEIEEALFHQSNEYAIGFHDAFDWLKNKLSQNKYQ